MYFQPLFCAFSSKVPDNFRHRHARDREARDHQSHQNHRHDPETLRKMEYLRLVHEYWDCRCDELKENRKSKSPLHATVCWGKPLLRFAILFQNQFFLSFYPNPYPLKKIGAVCRNQERTLACMVFRVALPMSPPRTVAPSPRLFV